MNKIDVLNIKSVLKIFTLRICGCECIKIKHKKGILCETF